MVISQIGSVLRNEIRVQCSNKFGLIVKSKAEAVKNYSSDQVVEEMKSSAAAAIENLHPDHTMKKGLQGNQAAAVNFP